MSDRETLTWERLKITPQQQAKALLASRLAAGANALLALGEIDRERHTGILKMLAPDLKPVIGALNRHFAAQGIEARSGETREAGLNPKDESPVAESDAPQDPQPEGTPMERGV